MLKRLALALTLSTAIVAAGAGTATAGPAIAGVAAFAATPLGGVVVNAGIGLAFSAGAALIDNLTSPPEERPGARPVAGYSGTVPTDPTAPIGFVMGTRAIAGTIVYRGSWGNAGKVPNAYYVEERVLSDVPLADDPGPAKILIGKKLRAIDWDAVPTAQGYPVPAYSRDGKDHAWVRFYSGEQTAASSYMLAKFGTHPDQPYTESMIGRGQAKLIVTFRYHPKLFKTGFPEWKAVTAGIAMYNIAKDTSAGGDGAHRINDPATWEPSDLLPVHIFNGLYGVRYGAEWVWGGQNIAASQLPAANWIAAIAEANTSVARKGGGTELQYAGGMEIAGDMEPASVFEHQLRGCSGRFAEIGGIFKMICGLPASPVMSFTDANIVVSRAQQFEPFPRPEATFNAILSKYWEPSGGWQLKDVPERRNAAWETEDGGYRPANVTYEAVISGTQAQRLDAAALADGRRWRTHAMGLPPEASELEPLDMVAWTSDRRGYAAKTFLIDEIDDEETFEQFVTMREVDPADHGSYDPETDELPMVFPTLDLAGPDPVVMAGYQAFGDTFLDADGIARRATIRVRIPAGMEDVQDIKITVRLKDTAAVWWSKAIPYEGADLADGGTYDVKLDGTFIGATAYQVLPVEIPYSSRDVVAGDWLDATTPAVDELGAEAVHLSNLSRDLQNRQELITTADAEGIFAQLAALAAKQEANGIAVLDAFSALREWVKVVSVQKDGAVAGVARAEKALVTVNSALASLEETVVAVIDDNLAGGMMSMTAEVDALASTSKVVLGARARVGDTEVAPGLIISAGIDSEGNVVANDVGTFGRFSIFIKVGEELVPLTVLTTTDDGKVRMNTAVIDLIESSNGVSYWNLLTGARRTIIPD